MIFSVVSLGCAKNQVDTEYIISLLIKEGFEFCGDYENADFVIVNTCGFIQPAIDESIETICELKNSIKKTASLFVVGCLVERNRDIILNKVRDIHGLFGINEIDKLIEKCKELKGENILSSIDCKSFLQRAVFIGSPGSAYLKISDGCNNRCSYCTIPYIRGGLKSKSLENIKEEIDYLISLGIREINIIAQDTTAYGTDLYNRPMIDEILRYIAQKKEEIWTRLLYTHPAHLNKSTIDIIAKERNMCKYIDIPIQHIDNEILKRMGRKIDSKSIYKLIEYIRSVCPDMCIRTTLIVGFPGETEKQFERLVRFIQDIRFDRLGVFTYFREEGTPAYRMKNQIPEYVKEERADYIMQVQKQIHIDKNRERIGKKYKVIITNDTSEIGMGRSEREAPDIDNIIFIDGKVPKSGTFCTVLIEDLDEYDLLGRVV